MRRTFSILLTSGSLPCLALLVAVLVLWPRSYWRAELLVFRPWKDAPDVNARTNMGSIVAIIIDDPTSSAGGPAVFLMTEKPQSFWLHMLGNVDAKFDVAGLRYKVSVWSHGRRDSLIVVPFYLIALVLLIGALPAIRAIVRWVRRRRRFAAGYCQRCGYDRRASPSRCPECGDESELTPATVGSSSPA